MYVYAYAYAYVYVFVYVLLNVHVHVHTFMCVISFYLNGFLLSNDLGYYLFTWRLNSGLHHEECTRVN